MPSPPYVFEREKPAEEEAPSPVHVPRRPKEAPKEAPSPSAASKGAYDAHTRVHGAPPKAAPSAAKAAPSAAVKAVRHRHSPPAAAAAAAAASHRHSAAEPTAIKDYAIGNPVRGNLREVALDDPALQILFRRHPPLQNQRKYRLYREIYTNPKWIYVADRLSEPRIIVTKVVNVEDPHVRVYRIREGKIITNPEAFGFKTTEFKNRGGGRVSKRRRTQRRSTTHRRS